MSIRVELFGIPRLRAGVAATTAEGSRLDEILADLAPRFPDLAGTCFDGGSLRAGYLAGINGEQFVTNPATTIKPDSVLLIFSANSGG